MNEAIKIEKFSIKSIIIGFGYVLDGLVRFVSVGNLCPAFALNLTTILHFGGKKNSEIDWVNYSGIGEDDHWYTESFLGLIRIVDGAISIASLGKVNSNFHWILMLKINF